MQCQGIQKATFYRTVLQEMWLHGPLCWANTKSRRVTLAHHVPEQQHCLGLVCSTAAPTVSQVWCDASLRGVACGGQLLLQGCVKLPFLTIYPFLCGRHTEQKQALAFSDTWGHVWATNEVGSYHTASLCDHKQRGIAGVKGEWQRVASHCPGSHPVMRGERNAASTTDTLKHVSQSPNSSHTLCSARALERVALWPPQVITRWCLQRHCR